MLESTYKTFEELPLYLNANSISKLLGISPASCYELMHEKGFPTLRIGSRIIVPRDKLIIWLESNTDA